MDNLIKNYIKNFKKVDKLLKVNLFFIGLFLFPINIIDPAYIFFNLFYVSLAGLFFALDKLSLQHYEKNNILCIIKYANMGLLASFIIQLGETDFMDSITLLSVIKSNLFFIIGIICFKELLVKLNKFINKFYLEFNKKKV